MNFEDKLWSLAIRETEKGTIYYPRGSYSSGYILQKEELEQIKKEYSRSLLVLTIFSTSLCIIIRGAVLFPIVFSMLLGILFKYSCDKYLKKHGVEIDNKMSINSEYRDLGEKIGGSTLTIIFVLSIVFMCSSIVHIVMGDVSLLNIVIALIFTILTLIFGYSVRSNIEKI